MTPDPVRFMGMPRVGPEPAPGTPGYYTGATEAQTELEHEARIGDATHTFLDLGWALGTIRQETLPGGGGGGGGGTSAEFTVFRDDQVAFDQTFVDLWGELTTGQVGTDSWLCGARIGSTAPGFITGIRIWRDPDNQIPGAFDQHIWQGYLFEADPAAGPAKTYLLDCCAIDTPAGFTGWARGDFLHPIPIRTDKVYLVMAWIEPSRALTRAEDLSGSPAWGQGGDNPLSVVEGNSVTMGPQRDSTIFFWYEFPFGFDRWYVDAVFTAAEDDGGQWITAGHIANGFFNTPKTGHELMGFVFMPHADCVLKAVRQFFPQADYAAAGSYILYGANNAVLASGNIPALAAMGAGWHHAALDVPVSLTAGQTYKLVMPTQSAMAEAINLSDVPMNGATMIGGLWGNADTPIESMTAQGKFYGIDAYLAPA